MKQVRWLCHWLRADVSLFPARLSLILIGPLSLSSRHSGAGRCSRRWPYSIRAKRWINVPGVGELLQVSELVKLIIIIVLARFFAEVRSDQLDSA